ncbi:hypothetical protein AMJ48_02350 [Parcubacteria bacterium DG_74_1]|nr:MAG: hypothetical protein AMJ48_02350 [Parcubacteria bacterium DG_74_1]
MSKGHLKIIIAVIIFSFSPLFVKLIPLDGISFFWAFSFSGVIFLTLKILCQNRFKELLKPEKSIFAIALLGIATTINNALFFSAIKVTTIANAILTHYLAPFFLVFLAFIFLKEKIEKSSLLALLLCLVGLIILVSPNELSFDNKDFVGLALGTLSAIFFASEIILKKELSPRFRPDTITLWHIFLSVLLLLPFISFTSIISLGILKLAIVFLIGIFVVGIGVTLFVDGLREVKAQQGGALSYLEPLGAVLWGILFVGEAVSLITFLGGGLILFGGYLIIKQRT